MILRKVFVYQEYPENLMKLYQLAYNFWWAWDYQALNLFHRIDTQLFREVDHNPVRLLYSLPKERIEALSSDRGFLFELGRVWERFQEYLKYVDALKRENNRLYGIGEQDSIAYFMMECGLHESLPIYAGGLGILCGDYLKCSSDMGLPVIGVGLLYKYGYFDQRIGVDGRQVEEYVEFENHLVPLKEARKSDSSPAYVDMTILDQALKVKVWQIDIGQTRLILLDTDIEDNPPHLRDITHELYVADKRKRLQQELVLGIGGMRALDEMDVAPALFHLNEAHSAFAVVARLEKLMKGENLSFSEARAVIRASTIFTTHTPVRAGNENFESELVRRYLLGTIEALGISYGDFENLGFVGDDREAFWLPALSIRFSRFVNGVSRQHRGVTRKIWASLFPERPEVEIPIQYVTNGVHQSWISETFDYLFSRYMGPDYVRMGAHEDAWNRVFDIPDEEIWEEHRKNKRILVPFVREKIASDLAARGFPESKGLKLASLLNPDYLTIVFARRFAHYKRPTLILKDRDRLKKILTNPERPIQLIFSGKAHPADERGKDMVKQILDFAREYGVEDRVTFLEDYDINVARHLVWGADVWLNTPAPDMEGSGTSGMKAAMNGVLNLSVLEGWWEECYDGANGWAITAGELYNLPELREEAESEQIYTLLEEEIAERFYARNGAGIPQAWVHMMKESIYSVGYEFSMNRVLTDYQRKLYIPAMMHLRALKEDDFRALRDALVEEKEVLQYWDHIEITHFSSDADRRDHLTEGETIKAECSVYLGEASPELFRVELFYLFNESKDYKTMPMELITKDSGTGHYVCSFSVEGYGVQGMNVRVRPAKELVEDLHPGLVKWKD